VGFGSAENVRGKGKAVEQAKKTAVTDALKRAFRQFGSALGNCCYDKEYIAKIKDKEREEKRGRAERGRGASSEGANRTRRSGEKKEAREENYVSIDDLPASEA